MFWLIAALACSALLGTPIDDGGPSTDRYNFKSRDLRISNLECLLPTGLSLPNDSLSLLYTSD